MAKIYQYEPYDLESQANWDAISHSILFADDIRVAHFNGTGNPDGISLVVTSAVDSSPATIGTRYLVLADDAASETSVDVATGKFVEGNLIAGYASLSEIQSDIRDYVAYNVTGSDLKLFVGVCGTTQSQDYTPAMLESSRVIKMVTPAQVKSLGL